MTCRTVWKRFHLYRKFEKDIWGIQALKPLRGISQLIYNYYELRARIRAARRLYRGVRYVYRIDLQKPAKRRKRLKWKYVRRKLTRLFYLILTHKQANRLAKRAFRFEGLCESYLILFIECRLFSLIYRLNFIENPFLIRDFLKKTKDLLLNKRPVNYYNQVIKLYQILKIRGKSRRHFLYFYKRRLRRHNYYFKYPRYLYINFKFLFILIYKFPKMNDLAFPNKAIDIYRLTDSHY